MQKGFLIFHSSFFELELTPLGAQNLTTFFEKNLKHCLKKNTISKGERKKSIELFSSHRHSLGGRFLLLDFTILRMVEELHCDGLNLRRTKLSPLGGRRIALMLL